MRRLAVFDIDGTLTDTNAVDEECFLRAVADVLGLDAAGLRWSEAPHVTDSDLLRWLCQRYCDRPLREGEAEATISRFLELLQRELRSAPERFRPMPGAPAVLEHLREFGWEVALATGGWEPSARLKLAAAGLAAEDLVLASASDAPTRPEILELAVRKTSELRGEAFSRIVAIGDAAWDLDAAAALGWPFVGIASGERANRLRAAGTSVVLQDLANPAALRAALEAATVP
jgi:phosphoglycolate phosphatase-like HAD superfamily hydrolase